MQPVSKKCFVIMPFSQTTDKHTAEYWDAHYHNFLEPLINSCNGVKASRSTALRQDIQRQIVNDLVFSDIVLADLTDANVNVYWELGVRLSFRHGTITIAEKNTKIPFDISTKGVLFYPEQSQREEFILTLTEVINHCASNPNVPDSFVLETITGRGSIYSVVHHQEILQRIEGLISESKLNTTILLKAMEAAFENRNRSFSAFRTKWGMIVTRMSTSALDLLLAEHYLEENGNFYEYAHTFLALIYACNKVLDDWSTKNDSGKWLIENEIAIKQSFAEYQKKLNQTKEKLSKCC